MSETVDRAGAIGPRDRFSWPAALAELERRKATARQLGGADRVTRQHAAGKGTVRERIEAFCDSFIEVGELTTTVVRDGLGNPVGSLPAGYVCGLGEIDGRPVAVGGEDYTVRGGAPTAYLDRLKGGFGGFIEDLAREYRIPLVLLIEGAGGDVANLDKGHGVLPSTYGISGPSAMLGEVPVLAAVLGPAAGATAARAILSHFSVMTPAATLFSGGPPLVRAALGIEIDKHELGGTHVHTEMTGSIDNPASDEADALQQIRAVLSYLPSNVWQLPARGARTDPADRSCDELLSLMPESRRQVYDAHPIITSIFDQGSVFEIGPRWACSLITALCRIDGHPVGVVANNPAKLAGAMDARAAEKQMRFVELCSTFHLPLIFLVDVPGLMVGPKSEREGVVRWGVRAARALVDAPVPVITVHTGRVYGLAGMASAKAEGVRLRIAWPSVEVGDVPIAGGLRAAYRREIEDAPDADAYMRAVEDRLVNASTLWRSAEAFAVEDVIDPRQTRKYLATFINAAQSSLGTRLGPWLRNGYSL